MRRIDAYFNAKVEARHAADVQILIREIPELGRFPDRVIEAMYHDYSEETMCAGWLVGPDVDGFRAWLEAEIP